MLRILQKRKNELEIYRKIKTHCPILERVTHTKYKGKNEKSDCTRPTGTTEDMDGMWTSKNIRRKETKKKYITIAPSNKR